jgi:uncharacterized protein (TIGR03437 family)
MDKSSRPRLTYCALFLCATAIGLHGQTLTTLLTFNGSNGATPADSLVQGADGNLYGTTENGGTNNSGTVFRLNPGGSVTTLYSFSGPDGAYPFAGLILASDGNFYGTTHQGGTSGVGTVFKITPGGTLTTLYSFCSQTGCSDGEFPFGNLLQASDGNFYGTTNYVGNNIYGTVYRITPGGTLTTLYSFAGSANGTNPNAGLIQASDGNLYGTTYSGGGINEGTVFKITPAGTLTTLHSFCSNGIVGHCDGANPVAGLIQATDGNFYGTTESGGAAVSGIVFKITPGGTLTMLYSFCTQTGCADGSMPQAGLVQASDGNFYGTTSQGGTNGSGTVFRLTPGGTLTTLYSFCAQAGCTDGGTPVAALIQASDGNLYGTTSTGGANSDGTVFKVTLAPSTNLPAINQSDGVVSGASFQAGIAPGGWITIFGTALSSVTDTWANSILNGKLPTSLDGVKVEVDGEPAYIAFVSPTQINAVAPNLGTGTSTPFFIPTSIPVTVTNSSGVSPAINAPVQILQPAFFQWPGHYAVATRQDFSLAVKSGTFPGLATTPAKPGDVIILWGTGFGPTSPSAPQGVEVPSGTIYNTATPVTVNVGGTPATIYGAALAPGFAGLYQVAIQIPTSLSDSDYSVVATVSGAESPSTTLITVQQ